MTNVEQLCDAAGIHGSQVSALTGTRQLNTTDCIMHFDRPAYLTSTPVLYATNTEIDTASVKLMGELYPCSPNIDCFPASVVECPGWIGDNYTNQRMYSKTICTLTTDSWSRISALTLIDLGTNAKYQATAYPALPDDGSKSLKLNIGAQESNVHVHNIVAMFLSFDKSDLRIRTGFMNTVDLKGGNWNVATPGEKHQKRFEFTPPFKSTPQVVAFIFSFSLDKETWIRMSVHPKSIDKTGFTLLINTWDGKLFHRHVDFQDYD
jgi:hypothetical protein